MDAKGQVYIVGSGVIGLSIGIALLKAKPTLKVTILEKEVSLGFHASGRNSGVIHAGFYYSPDSLKAKFCREGNVALIDLIIRNNLDCKRTGKIVVTQNSNQVTDLTELQRRGIENGVELELLEATDLPKFEPLARTDSAFLWSPSTSVADPGQVIKAMAMEFENLGGVLHFNQKVEEIRENSILLDSKNLAANLIFNCAGTHALRLAQNMEIAREFAQLPFMGLYRYTENSLLPLQTLVYPVPDKNYPFLGIHFTVAVDGKIKIGPSAIPILGSEQYQFFRGIDSNDLRQSFTSLRSLARSNFNQSWALAKTELPNLKTTTLIEKAAILVPASAKVRTWKKYRPGIRAQLVEKESGLLVQDFKIAKTGQVIHVLNSVSPGWTSSLSFGSWIADQGLELLR
jgi:L-2-hydroxyglutarate oxidase